MSKFGKRVAIGCASISILVALIIMVCAWVFFFVQPVYLKNVPNGILVDLQVLGEYQANFHRLKLQEKETGKVIWETQALKEFDQVWTFPIFLGRNETNPKILARSKATIPENSMYFNIESSKEYQLEIWTSMNGWESHRNVEFIINDPN